MKNMEDRLFSLPEPLVRAFTCGLIFGIPASIVGMGFGFLGGGCCGGGIRLFEHIYEILCPPVLICQWLNLSEVLPNVGPLFGLILFEGMQITCYTLLFLAIFFVSHVRSSH